MENPCTFEDQDQNPPPDIFDMVTVRGWTLEDKTCLVAVLLDMAKEIIQRKLEFKITQLQKNKVKTMKCTSKISQLKTEIEVLKHRTWENMGMQMDQDFDWEEVALKLNNHYSASEYKAVWEKFFHPSLNKKRWSTEEHQELQHLVAKTSKPVWESIAKTLNTGRTAYQCFSYYQANISHAVCRGKWSQKEMDYLLRVVNLYKKDNFIPWGTVAGFIKNRTKIQCYNKYFRMIEVRKGRFIPEEDTVILNFVNVYGTDFRKMSTFLKGRSMLQLRVRYDLLTKKTSSATWSVEDDKKLLEIVANQDQIAKRASFANASAQLPGKDRQNIRSRYNTLKRWLELNPTSDISLAPRRGPRRLTHGKLTSNLMKSVHAFENKMKERIRKSMKSNQRRKLSDTEDIITTQDSH